MGSEGLSTSLTGRISILLELYWVPKNRLRHNDPRNEDQGRAPFSFFVLFSADKTYTDSSSRRAPPCYIRKENKRSSGVPT
eukprot:scaffold4761_cov205-Amphora_coffeaeformis.AAC.10